MLEKIYNKVIPKKYIAAIKRKTIYKKLFYLAIFLFNLSIYSIPLLAFHLEVIKVPKSMLSLYTKFVGEFIIIKDKKITGNYIVVKDFIFQIDQECIGIKSILGLFAIIMATPTKSFVSRIKYFLLFLPLVFFINIVRILSTIYGFYLYNISPFFLHNILWDFLNTFVIAFLWFNFYRKNKYTNLFDF